MQSFWRSRMNMYYTYVLLGRDLKNKKEYFYTGMTDNLKRRLYQHKTGNVKTTKKFGNTKLVYCEICLNKTDARKRELQLKTGFGKGFKEKRPADLRG